MEGDENDQRAGVLLKRKAERAGTVQPGEKKADSKLNCGLSILKWVL